MSTESNNIFESYLQKFTESDWDAAISSLLNEIHEVDRNAVRIWFRFFPLALHRYLATATDLNDAMQGMALQGDYGLAGRIDDSHAFLYGHRFWATTKAAIEAESQVFQGKDVDLAEEITQIAAMVAEKVKADKSLLVAITAVGFMTLVQVGLERFVAGSGEPVKPAGLLAKSPDAVVAARSKDDSQGLFGFLKTVDKQFSVIHDERSNANRFPIMNDQEIASASALDRSQNWQAKDPRCWEGPVPVECTSASCGTCWVGVIAGQEKLSTVARRERRAVNVFGYNQTDDEQPLIRLACQARASGNVTIVIPPWNAVFGKKIYGNVDELELEPATTSARVLREVVKEAAAGDSRE